MISTEQPGSLSLLTAAMALAVALGATGIAAQEPPPAENPNSTPSVVPRVHRTGALVTQEMTLYFWISNFQTAESFSIEGLKVDPPPGFEGRITEPSPKLLPRELASGGELLVERMVSPKEPWWSALLDLEILLLLPRPYEIAYVVEYKRGIGTSADQPSHYLFGSTTVDLEPPLGALLVGGVSGALLLALFVPIYRLRDGAQPGASPARRGLARLALRSLLLFVSGAAVSIITILLLTRWGELELPLSVDVNDFYGGLVVGLFSYLIGEQLYQRLLGSADQGESS